VKNCEFRIENARKQLAKHVPAKPAPSGPAGAPAQPNALGGRLGGLLGRAVGGETGQRVGETLGAVAQGAIGGGGQAAENAIIFEPMPVKKAALWLAVTGAGLTEQPGAQIEARAAIYHSLSMPIAQFQAVFDALMGGSVALMRGELRLDLGAAISEVIPLELRFDRMCGELFTLQATRDAANPSVVDVALTNAIESALEVRKLDGWIAIGGRALHAAVKGLTSPATIGPGASQSLQLACAQALPEGEPQPFFDFRDVIAKPDPTVIWGIILDPSTPAEYLKTVQVRAVSGMFDAPPDKPNDRVLAILVQFEKGGTVELTPAKLEAETKIRMPLADVILGAGGPPVYRYRCQVIRAGGRQQDTVWREDSFDILFPALPNP
jgi:hypothetical protein